MWNRSVDHRAAAAGILAVGVWCGGAIAQEPQEPPMLSVQFPGGTVAEYVEALRAAIKPEPANIALSEPAAAAILPTIRLEKVTVGTALAALEYIAPSAPGERWVIAPLSARMHGEPDAFAVTLARRVETGVPGQFADAMSIRLPEQERAVQIFSIRELMDRDGDGSGGPETILSAVELALQMRQESGATPPEVKFHADSGLLIINASRAEVGSVQELLARMRDDAQRSRAMAEERQRRQIEDELELNVTAAKLESCKDRLALADTALRMVQQFQERGEASSQQAREAEMERLRAKSELDIVAAEHKAAQARLSAAGLFASGEDKALRTEVQSLRDQVAQLRAKIKELEGTKR